MNAKELTLRIVPLNDVLLHEQVEARRVDRLITQLKSDWLLKNPPIVTQYDGKYILLDGATRVTALKRIHCRDVVVQIVDYAMPGLVLETWNHMLLDLPADQLLDALARIPGLRLQSTSAEGAEQALNERAGVATIVPADGRVLSLISDTPELERQAGLLNQVVASYEGRGEMYRVAHTDLERLLAEHGRLTALVVFPRFRPEEIQRLALNGTKLPMGITRHIIPGRVLHIDIPLGILERDQPLEAKNAWLDNWMKEKMIERHVRYYQEPVFLFDE
jgi:hypothetical protein